MLTTFWSGVSKLLFKGEQSVVPDLPLHRARKESWKFVSIGRILAHTVALTSTVPSLIARFVLVYMIFSSRVDDECLIQDFLMYVTMHEKSLLEQAMLNFDLLT